MNLKFITKDQSNEYRNFKFGQLNESVNFLDANLNHVSVPFTSEREWWEKIDSLRITSPFLGPIEWISLAGDLARSIGTRPGQINELSSVPNESGRAVIPNRYNPGNCMPKAFFLAPNLLIKTSLSCRPNLQSAPGDLAVFSSGADQSEPLIGRFYPT